MSLIYAEGTPNACDLLIKADAAKRERAALDQKVKNGDVSPETAVALVQAIQRDTQAAQARDAAQDAPAPDPPVSRTHAIVIGVGDYPYLLKGTLTMAGHPAAVTMALGQLTSPPVSAMAFADWLMTRFQNTERPLGTVELLLSPPRYKPDDDACKKLNLPTGTEVPVENATLESIKQAFARWLTRCNAGPQERSTTALFYFCGHGVSQKKVSLLLPEDFGENPVTPFDRLIDLTSTHLFMGQSRPDTQYFFIDACREEPFDLLAAQEEVGVTLKGGLAARFEERDAPIFSASARGKKAHGADGKVSYFTQALLRCLDGVGSRKKQGHWQVASPYLQEGMEAMLTRIEQENAANNLDLSKAVSGESNFVRTIHFPDNGRVLINVVCQPETALPQADLFILDAQGNPVKQRPRQPTPWLEEIPAGSYQVGAKFDPGVNLVCPPSEVGPIIPPELDEPWKLVCQ